MSLFTNYENQFRWYINRGGIFFKGNSCIPNRGIYDRLKWLYNHTHDIYFSYNLDKANIGSGADHHATYHKLPQRKLMVRSVAVLLRPSLSPCQQSYNTSFFKLFHKYTSYMVYIIFT